MPRIALSRASLAALQAEIERRKGKLAQLIAERDSLTDQIAEIEAVVGPQQPVRRRRRKMGRKAKAAAAEAQAAAMATAPAAKQRRKRGVFKQTGAEMILGLLKSKKALTTAQLNKAWKAEGRGGSADTSLCNLVAAKTLKREPVTQGQGSNYSLA